MQDPVVQEAIRRRVERYGLRVVCLGCGARGRHRPTLQGRLRKRPCPKCGARLRSVAWVRAHPAAAAQAGAEERAITTATTAWES